MIDLSVDVNFELQLQTELDIDLLGGATEEMFPSVSDWFYQSSDHRAAFLQVVSKRTLSRYKSIVDSLVCEVFPDLKNWCFNFYRGEGPHLRELLSHNDIVRIESVLIQSLAYASILYQAQAQGARLPRTWGEFNHEVKIATFGARKSET